jgi:hypothetical protein
MQRGDRADHLAVDLFGPWVVDVAAAQAGLDMGDRDLAVVRRQRAGHRGGGVALHDDPVGTFGVDHRAEPGQQVRGERVERLVGPHQVEVVLGHHAGNRQDLVEHPAVLPADAHAADEPRVGVERMDQREQLDRLRPGAEHGEDALAGGHEAAP